ncbi:MAG: methionyl-tRNA formyltransferase [Microbacteriaceae bacterium]|nr:MAG: methionyl-tRNA formyltransferase [Microbacteriaceae bacterium]
MRLVFAGTPSVAVPSLEAMRAAGHELTAVISRQDAPLGRKRVLTPSPVAAWAQDRGVPAIKANRLDAAVTAEVAALQADLGVIVAYGGLVREPLLSTPRLGWINLHFSLLPRWRGAAPVQHAILAGDDVTGVTVFQLAPGLDTGAVFATRRRAIGPDETSGELLSALAVDGAELLVSVVDGLQAGTAHAARQSGEPTAAPKITLDDAYVRWHEPTAAVYSRIRAVTPEPGAFTHVDDERFKLLEVRIGPQQHRLPPGRIVDADSRILIGTISDPLELLRVQPAGRRPMPAADWWRGRSRDAATVAE